MKSYNIMSYNADLKIAGNIITLKSYDKSQVYNYLVDKKHLDNKDYVKVKLMQEELTKKFNYNRTSIINHIKNTLFNIMSEQKKEERFIKSCYRAKTNIFDLVACNVNNQYDPGGKKQRVKFLTLTFKENITDIENANVEVTKFFKRLSYHIYKINKNVIKYLVVPELQNRGAWHYHIIIFNIPYVKWDKLVRVWGLGGVYINALKGKQDGATIAKYVTKYIAKGIEVGKNGNKTSINNNGNLEGQKRLSDYQVYKKNNMENKKRYFTSRGLHKPYKTKINLSAAELGTIINYLSENAKMQIKEDKKEKVIYYKEYQNEFRGEIKVISIEMVNKFDIKDFKRYLWGLTKQEINRTSTKIKYNWGMIDAIRRNSSDDIRIYELEKKFIEMGEDYDS